MGAGARRSGWPALRVKSLPALPRLHAITDERIARRPDLGEIVQLGQGSLTPEDARRLNPRWWIGKSVHDLREAEAAHAGGADYLLVGPVFPTATHPDRAPLGSARLKEIAAVGLPVIVIGGVTPERIPALLAEAAIHGVAAITALWHAADPADAARRMLEELNG
ncbi:MAG: thiamine phosphate synthase [Gemmatimonadetes bacterium]|nr:MAG: thiamine phosphate synthase [Gemmatimonadota bacterium]